MILRNLKLNESARRELKNKLLSGDDDDNNKSLTLYNISSCHDDDDDGYSDNPSSSSSSSTSRTITGLNCDFLLGPNNVRIEELTIERCRLDLEGAKILGNVLRSLASTLKSLKLVNLALDMDDEDCARPILEGIAEAIAAGRTRGGCSLESLDFRQIALPSLQVLRRRFFSALVCVNNNNNTNLKTLRFVDCDIRTEDVPALANTVRSLSNSLESLDLSRNHIDGTGLDILIRNGLDGHKCLKRLVLSHNPIGDDGTVHLSQFFSRSSSISSSTLSLSSPLSSSSSSTSTTKIDSLWLVDCDVWSLGCNAFATGLQRFDTLKELVVDGEWENHLNAIVESLETNVVLRHFLVISHAYVDYDCHHCRYWKKIEYYLALNRAHRRISNMNMNHMQPNLSFKLWPTAVLQKSCRDRNTTGVGVGSINNNNNNHNADIWYHLLQRRPELVASESNLA